MTCEELPRISYLTLLDTYILVSFAFLALVGGQNAFSALFTEVPFEHHSRQVVVAIFLVIHLVVGLLSVQFMCLFPAFSPTLYRPQFAINLTGMDQLE